MPVKSVYETEIASYEKLRIPEQKCSNAVICKAGIKTGSHNAI